MSGRLQENKQQEATRKKENPSLKGTFISVMLLGAFLILTWVGAFTLFLSR
ncbi:cytochrome c oxidase subunit 2A [Ornithinibacillus salinisoli]|uniref:Cytochrome c oxidase subunit 2A n=1 Tax=Ornithinibacillus salinisoli TaxID=1848459 RepID=A0ABW4W3A3_9BACI